MERAKTRDEIVMPNSTLYIMCGLPFSGKTTLARALENQCGFVHLDLDAIARAKSLFPEEGINDINLSIQEIERRRQANQANHQRPPVRDKDFMELAKEFEIPAIEENLLVYDGTQSIPEWINNHIGQIQEGQT